MSGYGLMSVSKVEDVSFCVWQLPLEAKGCLKGEIRAAVASNVAFVWSGRDV